MAATIKAKVRHARPVPHTAFRVSANRVNGRNFVIKIQLTSSFRASAPTLEQVQALEAWVVTAIDSQHIGDSEKEFGEVGWQAAQRTVFDWGRGSARNFMDEDADWKVDDGAETPSVYALCHFYWQGGTIESSPDGMTIASEHVVEEVVCAGPSTVPSVVRGLLFTRPSAEVAAMVARVGVSGVSEELMMEQWWGTVGPGYKDGEEAKNRWGAPTGYMAHPQWTAPGRSGREQSCNFGWRGYTDVREFNPDVLVWA